MTASEENIAQASQLLLDFASAWNPDDPEEQSTRLFLTINEAIVASGAVEIDWVDESQTSLKVDLTGLISSAGGMIWSMVEWLHLVTEVDHATIITRMRGLVDGVDLDSGLPGHNG